MIYKRYIVWNVSSGGFRFRFCVCISACVCVCVCVFEAVSVADGIGR